MGINIDKRSWEKVRLGDVAFEYSKRINNPSDSEFEKFVGSSNIDQWDFRVKSWESTDSVTSAMKLFEPNDYLLVRRSLYASDFRERAPRAHFHGVCSGDILTIREKPEYIFDGFLIGVLNSPNLWKYVVANASGSITRRIKWKDLANYEFLLPPKEQQEQVAGLLWAMDEVIEKQFQVLKGIKESYQVLLERTYSEESKWELKKLKKVADVNKASLKSSTDPKYQFEYLDIAGINEPKRIGELTTYQFKESPSRARRIIKNGSIVLSLVRPYHKSFVLVEDASDMIASTGTGVVDVKEGLYNKFLFHQFFSNRFQQFCEVRMSGTNYPAITPNDLKEFKVFIPDSYSVQVEVANKLDSFDHSALKTGKSIEAAKLLQKSFINQIF